MIERVLQIVAPHPCSGCGKVGTILCEDCKYDIINEPFSGCILCGSYTLYGICEAHASPITRAFTVGTRSGALEELINRLKFHYAKAAARPLQTFLTRCSPCFRTGQSSPLCQQSVRIFASEGMTILGLSPPTFRYLEKCHSPLC